jgi:hypothetical protein
MRRESENGHGLGKKGHDGIKNNAVRSGLRIYAPPGSLPKIIVPPSTQEALTRHQHLKMHHLGAAKVAAALRLAHFWPKLASAVKTTLNNCPGCELEKARQNEATGTSGVRGRSRALTSP